MNSIRIPLFIAFMIVSHLSISQYSHASSITLNDLSNRGEVFHEDFFFISVPKCGTHLLSKTICLLLNKRVDEGYDWVLPGQFNEDYQTKFLSILNNAKQNNFVHKTHVPWFPKIETFFLSTNHKWLFQIRDPRDAVISLVFYLEKLKKNGNRRDFFRVDSAIYDHLSLEERITAVMTGSCCKNYLKNLMKKEIPWIRSPYTMTVRFEDLIGPDGGGTKEKQLDTLHNIAQFLSIDISSEEIDAVAENIYSPWSSTNIDGIQYAPGQIGSWKEFFTEEHKHIFKGILGKELIELGYEDSDNW